MVEAGVPVDGLTDPSKPFFKPEVDYDAPPAPISLSGRGYVGGKAVGLMYAALHRNNPDSWAGIPHGAQIAIPETNVLTSEYFDRFIEHNNLGGLYAKVDYHELVGRYLRARFPEQDRLHFRSLISRMDYPLAIRSSSLLEDNINYSFAGIYLTLFITNRGDPDKRLSDFEAAVKRVFASTYNPDAHAYRRHHGLRGKEEKMSIIVQRMIGNDYGHFHYPSMAGVAFSRNYFPWSSRIQVEDGLVRLVFGLGTRAVGRNYARVFSPAQPMLRPEGSVVDEIVRYSQELFDALQMETGELVSPPLSDAVHDNPDLPRLASVLVGHEALKEPSPLGFDEGDRPVLTFRSILRESRYMPLVPMLRGLLKGLEERFGLGVDIEFACNFEQIEGTRTGILYLLQCRPLGVRAKHQRVRLPDLEDRTVIFTGGRCIKATPTESFKTSTPLGVRAARIFETQSTSSSLLQDLLRTTDTAVDDATEVVPNLSLFHNLEEIFAQIVHEGRNCMSPIMGYASMIEGALVDQTPERRWASKIVTGSQLMEQYLDQLSIYRMKGISTLKSVEWKTFLGEVLNKFASANKRKIPLLIENKARGRIQIHTEFIKRVILHVLKNAYESMRETGSISIVVEVGGSTVSNNDSMEEIVIRITDEGCGIENAKLKHIWKPYYSTKPNHFGLGLPYVAMAASILKMDVHLTSREPWHNGSPQIETARRTH